MPPLTCSLRTSTPFASICAAVAGLALLFTSGPAALGADAVKEIAIAAQHAARSAIPERAILDVQGYNPLP